MIIKDYYTVLKIPSNASVQQIKQAYRKLAMRYHPDKNAGDLYAAAYFHEVQEAYDVLSNHLSREQYHQQRWYQQSTGKKFAESMPNTPFSILQQCVVLNDYVKGLDFFRMDREALLQIIQQVLSAQNISMLHTFNDAQTNRQIFSLIADSCKPLHFTHIQQLQNQLQQLAINDASMQQQIKNLLLASKQQQHWNNHKIWLIVIVAIAISFLIFFLGK